MAKLRRQCHMVLVNSHITSGMTVSLLHSKLATAYGIPTIIISKCQLNKGSECIEMCRVDHKTEINIVEVQSSDYFMLRCDKEKIHLGGLDQELQHLKTLLEFNRICGLVPAQRTVGVILHGPPGCGKTSLGKALAQSYNAAFLNVESTNINKTEFGAGAEALKGIFNRAVSLTNEGPVILFLDELDMLCPPPSAASLGSRQLTSALVSQMDWLHDAEVPGLLVVAATNTISSVNPALRRPGRFERELLLNVPSQRQRLTILETQGHAMMLTVGNDVSLEGLALMTPGFVGADLQLLCQEALNHAFSRVGSSNSVSEHLPVQNCDFMAALHKVTPSLKKGLNCHVDLKGVKWDEIGGLEDIKSEIRQSIEWPLMHPESLRRMDLAATKGVLLYGPPGCCKTTLVRAAATSCHVTFLSLNVAQVFSPYVGESERIISEAFQKARALSPAILFFDEIDSLVGKRSSGGGQSRVQERVLATMLNEMDGIGTRLDLKTNAYSQPGNIEKESVAGATCEEIKGQAPCIVSEKQSQSHREKSLSDIDMSRVIVIGATNCPDMLDHAILRPGRLDRHIYVPPPDTE
ncbi:spermatogenesis-associated protein 5-like protein 1, partial [Elysia marginata]